MEMRKTTLALVTVLFNDVWAWSQARDSIEA